MHREGRPYPTSPHLTPHAHPQLACCADNESKWRQLGELALSNGQLEVAQTCFVRAKDLGGLLLLHSSHGDAQGMADLAALAGVAQRRAQGNLKAGWSALCSADDEGSECWAHAQAGRSIWV